jgi:hypothetical protein
MATPSSEPAHDIRRLPDDPVYWFGRLEPQASEGKLWAFHDVEYERLLTVAQNRSRDAYQSDFSTRLTT